MRSLMRLHPRWAGLLEITRITMRSLENSAIAIREWRRYCALWCRGWSTVHEDEQARIALREMRAMSSGIKMVAVAASLVGLFSRNTGGRTMSFFESNVFDGWEHGILSRVKRAA